MNTKTTSQKELEDINVISKIKLAALWIAFMFIYIYVDYLHLYMPSKINDILKGKVFEFDITQGFLLIALLSMTIPTLMIFFSIALPVKVNRLTNILVASIYIPYMLFNLVGETWLHMIFGAFVELTLLCLIICYAWKWRINKENQN